MERKGHNWLYIFWFKFKEQNNQYKQKKDIQFNKSQSLAIKEAQTELAKRKRYQKSKKLGFAYVVSYLFLLKGIAIRVNHRMKIILPQFLFKCFFGHIPIKFCMHGAP